MLTTVLVHIPGIPLFLTLHLLLKAALIQVDRSVELQRATNKSAQERAVAAESDGARTMIEDLHQLHEGRARQLHQHRRIVGQSQGKLHTWKRTARKTLQTQHRDVRM